MNIPFNKRTASLFCSEILKQSILYVFLHLKGEKIHKRVEVEMVEIYLMFAQEPLSNSFALLAKAKLIFTQILLTFSQVFKVLNTPHIHKTADRS